MRNDRRILKISCYRPAVKLSHLRNNREFSLMREVKEAIVLRRRSIIFSPITLSNLAQLRTIIFQLNSSRTKIQLRYLTINPRRVPPSCLSANQMKRWNKLRSVKTNKKLGWEIWLHQGLNLLKLLWRLFRTLPIIRTLLWTVPLPIQTWIKLSIVSNKWPVFLPKNI